MQEVTELVQYHKVSVTFQQDLHVGILALLLRIIWCLSDCNMHTNHLETLLECGL